MKAYMLAVVLLDETGSEWRAIGGGTTVEEALGWALESAPSGRRRQLASWDDLYGD